MRSLAVNPATVNVQVGVRQIVERHGAAIVVAQRLSTAPERIDRPTRGPADPDDPVSVDSPVAGPTIC
jgi:hypothetical protein